MGATQGPEREGKSLDEALRRPAAPTSPTGCLGGRSSVAGSCRGCVAERGFQLGLASGMFPCC